MGISLKTEHLKGYKDIAWLLLKHGRSDLVKNAGLDKILIDDNDQDNATVPPGAEQLTDDLEKLGPTYIKLGQLLSSRADIIPLPYIEALSRLQDKVEPFSYEEVESTISSELGVRISKAFSDFEPTPIAAASLGQVHRAYMRDGRAVAVKVQRPGIRQQVAKDIEVWMEVARFFDDHTEMGRRYQFQEMLVEFRKSLFRELDYREEAHNLTILGDNLRDFESIAVPRPVEDYTTSRVLTMTYIRGIKITSLSPLTRMEIQGEELAEQLFRAYLKQILVDGFFHADPHPGNVFLTDDRRIALLDLGMVGRMTSSLQEKLLQLLLAVSDGRSEDAARISIRIGERTDAFDELQFNRRLGELVANHHDARLEQIDVGKVLLEVTSASGECGIRLPPELTMLGKTLLNLDQVARALYPEFDPNAAVRRNAAEIVRQRTTKSISTGSLFSNMLDIKDFLEMLPQRVNRIMDRVANNELAVKVDAIDEQRLMEGIQKVANRITLGLVLAALIVGAALLMSVPTSFRILGYPGLAIVFFVIAASGGIALAINILLNDVKARKP